MKISINKYMLMFSAITIAAISYSCTPEDEDLELGSKVAAAFTVTDISTADMKNTYLLTSSTEDAFLYQWDLGDGSEPFSGKKIDTAFFENLGTYTITLTAISQGGHSTASQEVVVESDAVTGSNAIANGGFDSEEAWNFMSTGSTETSYSIENGALTFTNTDPAQSNIGLWQELELKGGRAYAFSASVKGSGMVNSWLEVLLLNEVPEEGTDPSGSAFIGLNTWAGCGVDPFDDELTSISCIGDGIVNIAEDGTYYLFIKTGSWDGYLGAEGLTIDDIQLIAQPRLIEGDNILTGSSMDDASVWTITNVGLALTSVEFTDGVMKFSNGTGSAQTNVGVWQAVSVEADQIYKLKATVNDPGSTGSWKEFYISTTPPADGVDYTTGRIEPGNTRSFAEASTVYVLIKVGSWDGNLGAEGVTVDDVELVEMN